MSKTHVLHNEVNTIIIISYINLFKESPSRKTFESMEYCFRTVLGAIQHFEDTNHNEVPNAEKKTTNAKDTLEQSDQVTNFSECKSHSFNLP